MTLKMKVKDVDDLNKIGRRPYFVNFYASAKINACTSSRLLPVSFRDVCIDVGTDVRTQSTIV